MLFILKDIAFFNITRSPIRNKYRITLIKLLFRKDRFKTKKILYSHKDENMNIVIEADSYVNFSFLYVNKTYYIFLPNKLVEKQHLDLMPHSFQRAIKHLVLAQSYIIREKK